MSPLTRSPLATSTTSCAWRVAGRRTRTAQKARVRINRMARPTLPAACHVAAFANAHPGFANPRRSAEHLAAGRGFQPLRTRQPAQASHTADQRYRTKNQQDGIHDIPLALAADAGKEQHAREDDREQQIAVRD